jgi:hypothetical protein
VVKIFRFGFYIFSGFCGDGWVYASRTDPWGLLLFDGSLSRCVGGQVMGLWNWDLELGVAVVGFFCFSSVVGTEL